jgi:hypothetical protein
LINCSKTSEDTTPTSFPIASKEDNQASKLGSSQRIGGSTYSQLEFGDSYGEDLKIFFESYDTSILKAVIFDIGIESAQTDTSDENTNIIYMVEKNAQLIGLLNTINPTTYYGMETNDPMVVLAGLLECSFQLEAGVSKPFPWSCIWQVVGGLVSGGSVINSYRALINQGASWATVRSFLWQSLKRYGGWAMAAGAIYDIVTECF